MSSLHSPGVFGVVLAGGLGTRFWPLSRSQYPKQVLPLFGQSLLHTTIERLLPKIPQTRLAVVSIASQADSIRLELYRSGWHDIQLWLEPVSRDTAPAVGLAALLMGEEKDSDIMAVFPTDHFIQDAQALYTAIDQGATLARAGYLVTLGIVPPKPDGDQNYIKAEKPLDRQEFGFHISQLIEKPGWAKAASLMHAGGCYWHSGICLFRRDVFLEAFTRHLPILCDELTQSVYEGQGQFLADLYQCLGNISLDHAILGQASNAVVVPADLGWSNVDSWGNFYELSPKDARGNVTLGKAVDLDSRNSLVFSPDKLAYTIGLEDVVVVNTPDALLVCHRQRVQEVEKISAELGRRQMPEAMYHPTIERPWGSYTVMESGPGYQVKHLLVAPGQRLSLQLHRHRAEHWVVVQGTPLVTIGAEKKKLAPGENVFVPLETVHRLENPGPDAVRIIEVQTGSYLGEDDIVRLTDDYWRASCLQVSTS